MFPTPFPIHDAASGVLEGETEPGGAPVRLPRLHSAGATPTHRLYARLRAPSEPYPTRRAISATLIDVLESEVEASWIRQRARYCSSGMPSRTVKRSAKDFPAELGGSGEAWEETPTAAAAG